MDELLPTCKPEKARHTVYFYWFYLIGRETSIDRPFLTSWLHGRGIDLWTKDGKFVCRVSRGEEQDIRE